MKISVDRDRCAGSGQCGLAAPAVFDQDDDGIVLLLDPEPAGEHRESIQTAIWTCPVQAIQVQEN
ncbi:ferredoxin [Catenulispora sp. GAS73]|uniref:ferredoxin n=1 Tax=Catenulispora sp. GAS73 TaxID=3156269 RepID=UPI003516C0A3